MHMLLPTSRTDCPLSYLWSAPGWWMSACWKWSRSKRKMDDAEDREREKLLRSYPWVDSRDELLGANEGGAGLDKGMCSSPIAIGGKAEFMSTEMQAGLLFFSFFSKNGIAFRSFSPFHGEWVSVTPFKGPLGMILISFSWRTGLDILIYVFFTGHNVWIATILSQMGKFMWFWDWRLLIPLMEQKFWLEKPSCEYCRMYSFSAPCLWERCQRSVSGCLGGWEGWGGVGAAMLGLLWGFILIFSHCSERIPPEGPQVPWKGQGKSIFEQWHC